MTLRHTRLFWPRARRAALLLLLSAALAPSQAATQDAPSQAPPAPLGPRIFCAQPVGDYGEALQGVILTHTYVLENRGDADLHIIHLQPKCGCTITHIYQGNPRVEVQIDKRALIGSKPLVVLKPGETCDLDVELDGTLMAPKPLTKPVYVLSNDPTQKKFELLVKADIKEAVFVEPNPLQFGEVVCGTQKTLRATVRLAEGVMLDLLRANATPPLSATFARVEQEDAAAPPCWTVDVTLTAPEKTGILSLPLHLETDHKKLVRIHLRAIATVRTTVSFACDDPGKMERVNFGRLPRERPGPVTRAIEIVNGDPAVPYRVTAVEVESTYKSSFATEIVEVEAGIRYRVLVRAAETLSARFFNGSVIIRADHPTLPEKKIPLVGQVSG